MSQTTTRLRAGLRELLCNFLPSVVFGLVGILLEEFSRLFAFAARCCDHAPRRTTSFLKLPRVASFRRTLRDSPPSSPVTRAETAERSLALSSSTHVSATTTRREVLEYTSPVSDKSPLKEVFDESSETTQVAEIMPDNRMDRQRENPPNLTANGSSNVMSTQVTHRGMTQEKHEDQHREQQTHTQSFLVMSMNPACGGSNAEEPVSKQSDRVSEENGAMLGGPLVWGEREAPTVVPSPMKESLVARRISAYEQLVTSTQSETKGDSNPPEPFAPVMSSGKIITSSGSPQRKFGIAEALLEHLNSDVKEGEDDTEITVANEYMFEDADSDAAPLRDTQAKKNIGQPIQDYVDLGSSDSSAAELDERGSFCLDSLPSSGFVSIEKPIRCEACDAPPGAQSLQELIPEILPTMTSKVSHEADDEELSGADGRVSRELFPNRGNEKDSGDVILDGDDVIDVESVENYQPSKSVKVGSATSLNTESYSSSPDSPQRSIGRSPLPSPASSPPLRTLPAGRQRNIRTSSRPSDLLIFSEDPMISCDDLEGSERKKKKKTRGLNDSVPLVEGTRIDPGAGEEYDSARMIVGPWLKQNGSPEQTIVRASTPVTKSSDDNSWQRQFADAESHSNRDRPRSVPTKGGFTDGLLFRQGSADVTTLRPASNGERQRSGLRISRSNRPRFHPSRLTSKVSLPARGSRPGGLQFTERSVSTFDGTFKDWPEYTPSQDDPTAVARRHMSDMSFGVKARQEDMLPKEVFAVVSEDALYGPDAPERFGGTTKSRWKRFGLPGTPRDAAGAVKSIIRRRRKVPVEDDAYATGMLFSNSSSHRGSEKHGRRSGNGGGELSFDVELPQETVYCLLEKICPECGFTVAIRRPNYKMKVAVPCDGVGNPLLVSVALGKTGNRRYTVVGLSRSKDDLSGAPWKDIEAASNLLRRTLLGNVEFHEDSFPSLSIVGSGIHSRDPQVNRS